MALTQTLLQIRTAVRRCADIEGESALERHPSADVNEDILRGLADLKRKLARWGLDGIGLSSTTITTDIGISTYALPSDVFFLISADLTAEGSRVFLLPWQPEDRASLTDPASSYMGIPRHYRVRGANVELLPIPQSTAYTVTLWYVPTAQQPSSDGTAVDTVNRLDQYVIWYAAREAATKDKAWDLADRLDARLAGMLVEVERMARLRDPAARRIVNEHQASNARYPTGSRRWR